MQESGDRTAEAVIDPDLLALLVCPIDKEPVRLDGDRLLCPVCGRVYPIEDGIPIMLVEDSA